MDHHYSLREAASALGVSYSKIWHAYAYHKIPWPARVGKTLVLDEDDLAALKQHFDPAPEREANGKEASPTATG